jgi:putative ABC transport system permease protein
MDRRTFARSGFLFYARTNVVVIAGVAIAVAVLTGALLTGDSVRASLRDLALQRLGNTGHVLTSAQFFREELAAEMSGTPVIALEGVVSKQDGGQRAGGVQVYGVDERFWKFHGQQDRSIADREALISPGLAAELNAKVEDNLLLRLEKPSAIPTESLHGRKEDAGKTVRFQVATILDRRAMGEFSLKPTQGAIKAVFIKLKRLQKDLEQTARINTVLFSAGGAPPPDLAKMQLSDLGIKVLPLADAGKSSVETESAVLSDALEAKAVATAGGEAQAQRFFTYLVNTIRLDEKNREVPYSLVTAVSPSFVDVAPGQIVLNDWTARDLGAKPGDRIDLSYYFWDPAGSLLTRQASFQVARIIPIRDDRSLAPTYPGITESSTLADWDPPFPMDLKKVRPVDEEYWKNYRTTPKGFIHIDDGRKLWGSRFGHATSVRGPLTPEKLRASIQPDSVGVMLIDARSLTLDASKGSTDFGEYFLYFSFFLVISALLLTAVFFQLNIEQRLREVGLLRALGFDQKNVQRHFFREGMPLAALGSVLGVLLGIGYSAFILYGLKTWWRGAVGTSELVLHTKASAVQAGFLMGLVTSFLTIFLALRGLRKSSPRALLTGSREDSTATTPSKILAIASFIFIALALALTGAGITKSIPAAGAFFGAGFLLLTGGVLWIRNRLREVHSHVSSLYSLGLRNATWKPNRSALCITLIAFAVFLLVSLESFRQSSDSTAGAGGFTMLAESQLPIVYDLNSEAGRQALNIRAPESKFYAFRLKPGDDASCLNLYEPRNPRVLGASPAFLAAKRFGTEVPWDLLDQPVAAQGEPAPAIADANSMQYVLHKQVGDTMTLPSGAQIKFVGALSGSVLQGEILISERNFVKLFPQEQGYRFFLIEGPEANLAPLEETLSDFGFDAVTTRERLAAFHEVENTYLSTFQALGGLGLLLGVAGLSAVLMRNVLERRKELGLLRAVGFPGSDLSRMVIAENAYLVLTGVGLGVGCALIAVSPALVERGWSSLPVTAILLLSAGVAVAGLLASAAAVRFVRRLPLLASLRSDS